MASVHCSFCLHSGRLWSWLGLDSDGEDGAKVNNMLAKAALQTHTITEGTAASHGHRIKREILFFIKFPQLCTAYMSFHTSAHLHTVLSRL